MRLTAISLLGLISLSKLAYADPSEDTGQASNAPATSPAPVLQAPDINIPIGKSEGLSVNARLLYGIPLGGMSDTEDLSSWLENVIVPISLEGGYRFDAHNFLGAYLSYGLVSEVCDDGEPEDDGDTTFYFHQANCSTSMLGYGISYFHTFATARPGKWAPWAGLSAGFETINSAGDIAITAQNNVSGDRSTATGTWKQETSGYNAIQFGLGADYSVADKISIGPMLQFGIGKYTKVKNNFDFDDPSIPDSSESFDLDDSPYHEWLYLGLKASYN